MVSQNQNTLHTSDGCMLKTPMAATGKVRSREIAQLTVQVLSTNCNALINSNIGCGVGDTRKTSYGSGLNAVGGGVWAMTFNSAGVSTWFWPRPSIPSDVKAGRPAPATWGQPVAFWSNSTCSVDTYFKPQVRPRLHRAC